MYVYCLEYFILFSDMLWSDVYASSYSGRSANFRGGVNGKHRKKRFCEMNVGASRWVIKGVQGCIYSWVLWVLVEYGEKAELKGKGDEVRVPPRSRGNAYRRCRTIVPGLWSFTASMMYMNRRSKNHAYTYIAYKERVCILHPGHCILAVEVRV